MPPSTSARYRVITNARPRTFALGEEIAGCVVAVTTVTARAADAPVRVYCGCEALFVAPAGTLAAAAHAGDLVKCPGCAPPPTAPLPVVTLRRLTWADLTARQVITVAAADLSNSGHADFSEWDLTVAAWTLDRDRFGMTGYERQYPDHKRVSVELIATRPASALYAGLLQRVGPNRYAVTPAGREAAAALRERLSADR